MPLIPNIALFQRKLGGFPIATYQAGETVIAAAATTGRLLILRTGAVAVLRDGLEIATVREPGAVFGELSVLLDQPHSADVRALEVSQFYVADAATLLRVDPVALLYVATVLARRLDQQALGRPLRSPGCRSGGRRAAWSRKRRRRSKDCWARAGPMWRMPAIPTTCSPPARRTGEALCVAQGAAGQSELGCNHSPPRQRAPTESNGQRKSRAIARSQSR